MPRDDAPMRKPDILRWPDLLDLAVGVWLGFSPWLLGFFDDAPAATWNALACGGTVIVLAAVSIESPARWKQALLAAVGAWLALSPALLSYAAQAGAGAATSATGMLVIALAAAGWYGLARRRAHARR